MGTMTVLPRSDGLTRADLDAMPDDGRRHELVDGAIWVTPSPVPVHQVISGNLYSILRSACPDDLRVLFAPLDVVLAADTVVVPDLVVARRTDLGPKDLPVPPLLAVEILSPSTRLFDLTVKRARYERAACGGYWVVDPSGPTLTAWELLDGAFRQTTQVSGGERLETGWPFPVGFAPSELLR